MQTLCGQSSSSQTREKLQVYANFKDTRKRVRAATFDTTKAAGVGEDTSAAYLTGAVTSYTPIADGSTAEWLPETPLTIVLHSGLRGFKV